MSALRAMNMRITVQALQDKLSRVAKQSLDRRFGYESFRSGSTVIGRGAHVGSTAGYLVDWIIPVRRRAVLQRQRLPIGERGRSSESRPGENPTYGSTRGLREVDHGED